MVDSWLVMQPVDLKNAGWLFAKPIEILGCGIDLIVVTHPGESKQFSLEPSEPWSVLGELCLARRG